MFSCFHVFIYLFPRVNKPLDRANQLIYIFINFPEIDTRRLIAIGGRRPGPGSRAGADR